MAADGQEPGVGGLAVEPGGHGQDRRGPEGMAQDRKRGRRPDLAEREGLPQPPGGVDEDDGFVLRAGQGVLDVELIVGVADDAREAALFQPLGGRGAQAVVPAAGVADPQDENGRPFLAFGDQRTFLWRTRPDASTSETSSGIRPRAWVAQLRHGS